MTKEDFQKRAASMEKMMNQKRAAKKAVEVLANSFNFTDSPAAVLLMPTEILEEWTVGREYDKGRIIVYNGVKYLILQKVTAQAHQPPDMQGGAMLAIYKPYRDSGRYPWMYGEYCEVGYERSDNGVWYKAIGNPGINIYPPSQVPTVWKKT